MDLIFDYWVGHLTNREQTLRRSVGAYIQHYSLVKVGITCKPERRLKEHQRSNKGWDKMIVKYHTTSVKYINSIEKILIYHHWYYVANEVAGGGGPNGNPPYYLYVLLKK